VSSPTSAKPTQLDWLKRDLSLLKSWVRQHSRILAPLADTQDPARNNYFETVASFYWACLDHAEGALRLLQSENRAALIPVQRGLLELTATLKYLVAQDDPISEAIVFKAYALLREFEWPMSEHARRSRQEILAAMPADLVETAKKRVSARKGWTGKSFRALMVDAGFSDPQVYSYMSEHVHARALFNNVGWEDTGTGRHLRLGYRLTGTEAEHAANFARRLVWQSHAAFWRTFNGPDVQWPTDDPFAWLDAQPD
jgi:hypothetical protein